MVLLTNLRVIRYYFVIRVFQVFFMAKKPITVKLEKEMLEDMDNECEGLGCNRTDFVIEAVQEKLEGKIEEPEPKVEEKSKEPHKIIIEDVPEPKITTELIPEPIVKEIPQDNSNKAIIKMVLFNDQYFPLAKRYNI